MAGATISAASAVAEAAAAAVAEGKRYFIEVMKKRDMDACGFAWVDIYKPGRKAAAELLANGFYKTTYHGSVVYQCQFMHDEPTQGLCCLEAANRAACEILKAAGFDAHSRSRMD